MNGLNGTVSRFSLPAIAAIAGVVLTIAGAIVGGTWGASLWAQARETQVKDLESRFDKQIYNLEYRTGLLEKAQVADILQQQVFRGEVNTKLDRAQGGINCLRVLVANPRARCAND